METRHFSHEHMLKFVEVGKDTYDARCYGCRSFVHGPAYTCPKCPGFFLHKSCVELPRQIKNHAFHQHHPLALFPVDLFVCDGCGEICEGFGYRCGLCTFNLDVKCATLSNELAKSKTQKGKEIKILINHFSHPHQLTRCFYPSPSRPEEGVGLCMACKQNVFGKLIFSCLSCGMIIHESCLTNMPEQVQSSCHPDHTLFARPLVRSVPVECGGCSDVVWGISFSCIECAFNVHIACAKYQTRAIKHDCHVHPLQHLEKSKFSFMIGYHKCNECGEYCKEAFLCCKMCEFYIHLECALPSKVKHIRHLHLLTLKNSIIEDDSGEYYCDMYEAERNPNHYAYTCEECNYIAHIHCVMSEVEPPDESISSNDRRRGKAKPDKGDEVGSKMNGTLLEGEGRTRAEKESLVDKLEVEIKQLSKQMENQYKKLVELQNKRVVMLKALDKKEGL